MERDLFETEALKWAHRALKKTANGTLFQFSVDENQEKVELIDWLKGPQMQHMHYSVHEKLISFSGTVRITYRPKEKDQIKPVDIFTVTVQVQIVTDVQGTARVTATGSMHDQKYPVYKYPIEYAYRPTNA